MWLRRTDGVEGIAFDSDVMGGLFFPFLGIFCAAACCGHHDDNDAMTDALPERTSHRGTVRTTTSFRTATSTMTNEQASSSSSSSTVDWDQVSQDVEDWGHDMLFGAASKTSDWKQVKGWTMFNRAGATTCFLKWIPDSRGQHSDDDNDNRVFPCIRVYSTIDAPIHQVCAYLSDADHYSEYNVLVVKHQVLQVLSPSSVICWGQSPQILFITPRDFVTFCSHKWREDGTQVMVSQGCDHPGVPENNTKNDTDTDATTSNGTSSNGVEEDDTTDSSSNNNNNKDGNDENGTTKTTNCVPNTKSLRAYSLRGAHFLSPDPEDPNKTKIAIVSHAFPGKDIPHWLSEQGVNMLAPIEAFKLMHNINKYVFKHGPYPEPNEDVTEKRSKKPAGMAMMGYAAFWPNGGGIVEEEKKEKKDKSVDRVQEELDSNPAMEQLALR